MLTNVGPDGTIGAPSDKQVLNNRANQIWHADSSFKPVPARASLLSAREIPSRGGDTEYASMRAAYAALPEAEKRAVGGLVAFATQERFVYRHAWTPHDLLLWDNRAVLHRATPFQSSNERRLMVRTTVAGDGPTLAARTLAARPAQAAE